MNKKKEKEEQEKNRQIANGIATGDQVNLEVSRLNEDYAKPKYTKNRAVYEKEEGKSPYRVAYSKRVFSNGKSVKDPYTGDKLLPTKEAKAKYGDNYREHAAQIDHIEPLKKVYQEYKDDVWVSKDDIREIANDDDNFKAVSQKQNNAKRDRSNEEYYGNDGKEYRKEKGVKVPKKGRQKAIEDGQKAKETIKKKIFRRKIKNVGTEFANSGWQGAKSAGAMAAAMSSMNNIVAVIKGKIPPEKALENVAKDTGKAAAVSGVTTGSMAVVVRTLSGAESPFLKSLAKSKVPGQVIAAVIATGGTLKKFCKGEINTKECILELGKTGVCTVTTGYAMAVGQAVIPIPFVGAAVGAMVGAALCGGLYHDIESAIDSLERSEREYEEIKRLSEAAIAQLNRERIAFEKASQELFKQRAEAINEGFDLIIKASMDDDVDAFGTGLNTIANAFNKDIGWRTMKDFDENMPDHNVAFDL